MLVTDSALPEAVTLAVRLPVLTVTVCSVVVSDCPEAVTEK